MDTEERTGIVLVLGLDLSDVSEHLVITARKLVASIDEVDYHLVHVVHEAPFAMFLPEQVTPSDTFQRMHLESARGELERLRDIALKGSGARGFIHTPIGSPADELAALAVSVNADLIVVEGHHPGALRGFHRSTIARIAKLAPCSVLAVKPRATGLRHASAPAGRGEAGAGGSTGVHN
jgi:nucleotide-binding universal stress UspA family protein